MTLELEYREALAQTDQAALRRLALAGATARGLELARPAYARLQPRGAGGFDFDPASQVGAFILPVRVDYPDTPESTDPEAAIAGGDIVDLVAFEPQLAVRWALRTGNAEWLGACLPQYLEPAPVVLHKTPLDWLRAGCEGLVCLVSQPLEILRFLVRFTTIVVDDRRHAAELQAVLDHPFLSPKILVRGS